MVPRFLIVKCSNCSRSGNKSDRSKSESASANANDDDGNANACGGTGHTGNLQVDQEFMS